MHRYLLWPSLIWVRIDLLREFKSQDVFMKNATINVKIQTFIYGCESQILSVFTDLLVIMRV